LVYRLSPAGATLGTYDHGVNGRPNESLPVLADSGANGLTAAGRRVWGLQAYNNRLYYAVWNDDMSVPSTADNEIWSVGINAGGTLNLGPIGGGGPKREITLPLFSGTYSSPVSDIAFSKSGKMLVGERSVVVNGSTYSSSAHQSRVLEYKLSGPSWIPSGVNYSIGAYSQHYNSAGGVDYDCLEDALATGDALMYPGWPATNSSVYLYGLQIIPTGGNTPPTATSTSYLIDLDGDTSSGDKTWIGDVVDYRDVCGCITIANRAVECISTNNTYAWNFCVTNNFNGPIGFLSFPDMPPGVTIDHDILPLNTVLQPGEGTCLTVYLTNSSGASNVCFLVGAHSTNMVQCCSITNCLTFTPCCAYFTKTAEEHLVPIPGQPNCYNYFFNVKNVSSSYVKYIYLTADDPNCITFTPAILQPTPNPLPPGGETTVPLMTKVCINPACLKNPLCFTVSLHTSNLVQCCAVKRCLPKPHGPIGIANPADGSVYPDHSNIGLGVILSGEIQFRAVVYKANDQIIASNGVAPFSAVWSNAPQGDYLLQAEGIESSGGGAWVSDPINVYVVGTNAPSGGGPVVLVAKATQGQLKFEVLTRSGTTCCIEYTESLTAPNWKLLQANPGDGAIMTVYDSVTNAPQRYYRARMY